MNKFHLFLQLGEQHMMSLMSRRIRRTPPTACRPSRRGAGREDRLDIHSDPSSLNEKKTKQIKISAFQSLLNLVADMLRGFKLNRRYQASMLSSIPSRELKSLSFTKKVIPNGTFSRRSHNYWLFITTFTFAFSKTIN